MYQVYSAKTNQGGREYQQDRMLIIELQDKSIYAILDGHGGNGGDISEFLRITLEAYLNSENKILDMTDKQLVSSCFHHMELQLRQSKIDCYMSGSTCSIVLVNNNGVVTCGYVGDSTLIICKKTESNFEIRYASKNHNCEDLEEKARIENRGGRVEKTDPRSLLINLEGPLRVFKSTLPYPGLAVTRSFGDECAESIGVTAIPSIQQFKIELSNAWSKKDNEWVFNSVKETCDFAIVVASDGLWDAISKEGVAKVCGRYFSRMAEDEQQIENTKTTPPIQAEKCVRHLISYAVKQLQKIKEEDNVTCICIFFGNAE
eukprot:NODE_86_length_22163_cov_0.379442.p8 type:complete len:317 gc:universal NODE_86_length_22163_cov_0.379442:21908-20958(-)